MANETPNHEYLEITDAPNRNNLGCSWIMSGCLFVLSVPSMILTVIAFLVEWSVVKWILASITVIIFVWALIERLSFCKLPKRIDEFLNRPNPRLSQAQRAKKFLGFDFGTEFKLRTTGSHDYTEILLDFSQEYFVPLQEFCKTQANSTFYDDSEKSIIGIMDHIILKNDSNIDREIITKQGFTKVQNFYSSKLYMSPQDYAKEISGWSYDGHITTQIRLEVDFDCRTLKMSCITW